MTDNVLIPLPGFTLPEDYPWRIRFIAAVDDQLRRLRASGHFIAPRFFGYFFQCGDPVAVSGNWTVTLDPRAPIIELPSRVKDLTRGRYTIAAEDRDHSPDFLLVHDRRDGACWLWRYTYGLRFVEATEAVTGDDGGGATNGPHDHKLLGP